MKSLSGYTDPFISPVTGLLARIQPLPDLQLGYIWMGDKDNRPQPSFKLIDLTIDLRSLEDRVEQITDSTFVLNHPSPVLPKAQALSLLDDGLMKNVLGQVEIAIPGDDYMKPLLPWQQVWVGDIFNKPKAQNTILLDNLPDLRWKQIWRGNLFGRPEESSDLFDLEVEFKELDLKVTQLQSQVIDLQNWRIAAEAQIEEILLEVAALQGEVAALQIQVAALEAEILALQLQVAALAEGLAALQGEVAALAGTVAGLGFAVAGLTLSVTSHGIQIGFLQSDVSGLRHDFNQATVTVLGDVVGVGLLNQSVLTKFAPDPTFTGKAMTLPSGNVAARPQILVAGMFRYNTAPV